MLDTVIVQEKVMQLVMIVMDILVRDDYCNSKGYPCILTSTTGTWRFSCHDVRPPAICQVVRKVSLSQLNQSKRN